MEKYRVRINEKIETFTALVQDCNGVMKLKPNPGASDVTTNVNTFCSPATLMLLNGRSSPPHTPGPGATYPSWHLCCSLPWGASAPAQRLDRPAVGGLENVLSRDTRLSFATMRVQPWPRASCSSPHLMSGGCHLLSLRKTFSPFPSCNCRDIGHLHCPCTPGKHGLWCLYALPLLKDE